LDSGINAIATVTVVDILKPYWMKGRADKVYLRAARAIAIGVAVLMVLGAVFFSMIEKESINDISWIVSSVFGGCLVGLFMIGFFTTRVGYRASLVALVVAVLVNLYLGFSLAGWLPAALSVDIQAYWVGVIVNLLFMVLAYGLSFIIRNPQQPEGLTVWTMPNKKNLQTTS